MTKKVAIMQPYCFPYIGYFNLVNCVDQFIFLDDVSYIKKGWINRNRFLLGKSEYLFTIPLSGASQNRRICSIELCDFANFREKFLTQIFHGYRKAKNFKNGFSYIEEVLDINDNKIASLAKRSVEKIFQHLDIEKSFYSTTRLIENHSEKVGSARIIAIVHDTNAPTYVNSIGGAELYEKQHFLSNDIELLFLKPNIIKYNHTTSDQFIPKLSIIDLIMNLDRKELKAHMESYELL